METALSDITLGVSAPIYAVATSYAADNLWVYCTSLNVPNEKIKGMYNILAGMESRRVEQLATRQLQHDYIVCHATLRQLLGFFLNHDPLTIPIRYSIYNKPFVELKNPRGILCFNLSHSKRHAVFAFTWNKKIGIDLEWVDPHKVSEATARQFFTPAEMKIFESLPETERINAFYSCWTRKEAFTKALGNGLNYPPNAFEVRADPNIPAAYVAHHPGQKAIPGWQIIDLSTALPVCDFKAALAIERDIN